MLDFKIVLTTTILTFVLFTGGTGLERADLAYGQFFDNSETNGTNSLNSTSSSTTSENLNAAEIVLLSQKLKKSSFGYRDLVGQVKNIGNDTATFVKIDLTTYDKDGGVLGTDSTYASANTLKPNQKSSFELSSSSDNFKGMDYYELSLQWRNPDFTEGYVENAQVYETEQNGSDEQNVSDEQNGSEAGSDILEKTTNEAADEINENAKKTLDKLEDAIE
jgi:hypothetical protein